MRKYSASITTFLLGTALGILGGILFAPTEGASTRDILTYQLKRLKIKLQAFIKELALVSTKNTVASKAKIAGQEVVDKTVQKAQKLLVAVNELSSQLESNN
ncbi:MAG: YtxH domain-containing protein [Bacteroidota bacterium]